MVSKQHPEAHENKYPRFIQGLSREIVTTRFTNSWEIAVSLIVSLPNRKLEHQVRLYRRLIHQLLCSLNPSRWYSVLKVLTRRRSLTFNRV
jgi:hypothetical protein